MQRGRGLGVRVRWAAGWVAASMLLTNAVALVRSVLTARLLSPDDFGLYSMVLTTVVALGALTTVGLDYGITSSDPDREGEELRTQLDATWTAELLRRLVVTVLLAALIYPAARFYGRVELFRLLPCAALVPLVLGFQNVGLVVLRNRISFARLFWHETLAALVGAVITVALALTVRNVWALVWGQLAGAVAAVALSYGLHPYRPRLSFDPEVFRQAFHFGKYATVIGVLAYVTTMADNVLIGKLFGTRVLGVYAVAYGLASLPAGVVMSAVGRATFPAYAGLAARGNEQVATAFTRSLAAGAALLVLITVPLSLLGPEIVSVLYGPKWAVAGSLLGLLSLVGLARGLSVVISSLPVGLGRPREAALAKVVEATVFLTLLYPLISRYGVRGAAVAGIAAYLAGLCERLRSVRRVLPSAFAGARRIVFAAFVSGACGAGAGGLILKTLASDWPRLVAGGAASMALTALALYRLMPGLRQEVRASIKGRAS